MTVTAIPRATGCPGYTETFPSAPESVTAARRLVRTVLDAWDMNDLVDDGVLVISELVSNSVTHTRSRSVQVTVSRPGRDCVRIGVRDASGIWPRRRFAADGDLHGRGLTLIDAVTTRWGTDRLSRGKRVWGELRRQAG